MYPSGKGKYNKKGGTLFRRPAISFYR